MMTNFRARLVAAALAIAVAGACSRSDTLDEGIGAVPGAIEDSSHDGIVSFVTEGRYLDWCKQPVAHPSAGPHPRLVRTYWNDILFESLVKATAGDKDWTGEHPVGSMAVKELYEDALATEIRGYAVSLKVAEGTGPESWLWLEGFAPGYGNSYYGLGHPVCEGCHAGAQLDRVFGRLDPSDCY